MYNENRRWIRLRDVVEHARVEIALADSRRLIAEIDALLERSHDLMSRQALLHRTWR